MPARVTVINTYQKPDGTWVGGDSDVDSTDRDFIHASLDEWLNSGGKGEFIVHPVGQEPIVNRIGA